ncbi:MAG: SpoIIE family protein phosphatase [Clostridia bacterium]|nr:SpoIIE family protein phosphatase [Clostridia bacterium]
MSKKTKRFSIMLQVAILFIIGILTTGTITYISERFISDASVTNQTEERTSQIADEVKSVVRDYPASNWLLRYWYEHSDELDVEYDVEFKRGTKTEEKCRLLQEHQPSLQLEYVPTEVLRNLPEEDKKLYAEITYSWLITRINHIKRIYGVDFLFCVVTEPPYDKQFFLFSAADVNSVRGTNYEETYILGTQVAVGEGQQDAMRNAHQFKDHLADAGKYVDYYTYLDGLDSHAVLIGLTYNLSAMRSSINTQTLNGSVYAIINQIVLSVICLLLLYFFLLHPLQKVMQNILLYKNTKDSRTVNENLAKIRPRNEIGTLSEDIAGLTTEIDDHLGRIENITAERERIDTELSLATRIQKDMLPRVFPAFPDRTEFDIFASMDPAREVGGDFYDFFLIDEDHLALVIADVSGKGIPAALYMMAARIILANNTMAGKTPAQILTDTNKSICSHNREEMFITVWLGILEISSGKLVAANAGHEYPIIRKPGQGYELFRDKHDFVVGGMPWLKYHEYEMVLEPGSRLFLYTDGLTEATDAQHRMFGTDRILTTLNEDAEAVPEETIRCMKEAVSGFVLDAEQFDDLTMLALSYSGSPKNRITVEARVENLPRVTDFVNAQLEEIGCSPKASFQIDVAVDEIFSNIAYYAYGEGTGDATVTVEKETEFVSVIFEDSGIPYNPLEKGDPDTSLPAQEREVGGLGIFLVKKTMDDMTYEYKDGKNVLRIRKHL